MPPLDQDQISRILGSKMLPVAGAVRFGGFGLLATSIAVMQAAEKVRKESANDAVGPAGDADERDEIDD